MSTSVIYVNGGVATTAITDGFVITIDFDDIKEDSQAKINAIMCICESDLSDKNKMRVIKDIIE